MSSGLHIDFPRSSCKLWSAWLTVHAEIMAIVVDPSCVNKTDYLGRNLIVGYVSHSVVKQSVYSLVSKYLQDHREPPKNEQEAPIRSILSNPTFLCQSIIIASSREDQSP